MASTQQAGSGVPEPRLATTALFLDLDGTVVDFRYDPAEVVLEAALRATLERLHRRLDGALAVVSGRRLGDIDRMLAPLRLPAAGLHGAERRNAAGRLHRSPALPAMDRFRAALAGFRLRHGEIEVEDKGGAIALHYRRWPAAAAAIRAFVDDSLRQHGAALDALYGKMVVEVRARGADKGRAIAAFMAEPPFQGRRPVFLGDDVTDEDGFRAVAAAGGIAIRVGAPIAAAAHCLPDVPAAVAWLGRLAADGEAGA